MKSAIGQPMVGLPILVLLCLALGSCGESHPTTGKGNSRPSVPTVLVPHVQGTHDLIVDIHEVTNSQFREFVEATGYVTTAERRGHSTGLDASGQWTFLENVSWRSALVGSVASSSLPVVHVSAADAVEFCKWRRGRLPTLDEVTWLNTGGTGRAFPWGDTLPPPPGFGNFMDKTFAIGRALPPAVKSASMMDYDDGFIGPAPVGSFQQGSFGILDLCGNVAEWCIREADGQFGRTGGSFYGSADPTARTGWFSKAEFGADDIGFRCVADTIKK